MEDKTMKEMSEFLMRSYYDYAREHGGISQSEYAEKVLRVAQSNWTVWVNKRRLPTQEYAEQLAGVLGPKVYEITGIRPRLTPEMAANPAFQLFAGMTPAKQERLGNLAKLVAGDDSEELRREIAELTKLLVGLDSNENAMETIEE